MTQERRESDVIIVGGGPVGMGLAIELGQRGVAVTLIERYEKPQPVPKGQNLTQRTMEHFHFWGAEKELRAARTIPAHYGIGGLTAYGTLLSDYHYDWLKRELVRPFYFTGNERLPQYATEQVLRGRARQIPQIEIIYGWSGESVVQKEDCVQAVIASMEGNARRTVQGRYLVGCDGSRSIVREDAGITQTCSDHDRRMVLLVFRSEELHALLKRYPDKCFYNILHPSLDGYWMFFGRVDLGSTWFFHAPVPMGTTADNFDFAAYLHRAVGARFAVDFEHVGFWDLRFAIADTYRAGNVFIAGDAAHSHPPYGGFGINTGFEDARNLGWKLAATLQGWGGEALLDSYDLERRPVFASTARDFIGKFIERDRAFLEGHDPQADRARFEAAWAERARGTAEVQSFEPNYEGSPIVFGPPDGRCSAVGSHLYRSRAGHHLAPQPLSSGGNMYDGLGAGFTLVSLDGDAGDIAGFRDAAAVLGIPLTVIEDSYAGDRSRMGARLTLVRPDQYVCWSGETAGRDSRTVLERVAGIG